MFYFVWFFLFCSADHFNVSSDWSRAVFRYTHTLFKVVGNFDLYNVPIVINISYCLLFPPVCKLSKKRGISDWKIVV
jgi:hypothetical protein